MKYGQTINIITLSNANTVTQMTAMVALLTIKMKVAQRL